MFILSPAFVSSQTPFLFNDVSSRPWGHGLREECFILSPAFVPLQTLFVFKRVASREDTACGGKRGKTKN
jgi:hypothetical protein